MKKYLVFCVCLAIVQLLFAGRGVSSGEKFARYEREISSLEDENQQLVVAIAKLSSYAVITQVALKY